MTGVRRIMLLLRTSHEHRSADKRPQALTRVADQNFARRVGRSLKSMKWMSLSAHCQRVAQRPRLPQDRILVCGLNPIEVIMGLPETFHYCDRTADVPLAPGYLLGGRGWSRPTTANTRAQPT